jgi:hypothetical protein
MKHKWELCDDIVEPEAKHWEENYQEKLAKRHKGKEDLWAKYGAVASIVLIFLFAIITLNFTTKELRADKTAIMENADRMSTDARRTTDNLNTLIEQITGKKILNVDNEQKRQELYNETKNSKN